MPFYPLINAARNVKKMVDDAGGVDQVTRPQSAASAPAAPMRPSTSNRAKANQAADMLRVPGRDVIRESMARRRQMLDDI